MLRSNSISSNNSTANNSANNNNLFQFRYRFPMELWDDVIQFLSEEN